MGLLFGYNPPSTNISTSSAQWLKYKAGTAATLYSKADDTSVNTVTQRIRSVFAWVLPQAVSKHSAFRFSSSVRCGGADGKAVTYYLAWTNNSPPALNSDFGSAASAPAIITASYPDMFFESVATPTINLAAQTVTFDFNWRAGYSTCILLLLHNGSNIPFYHADTTLKADIDTPEPAASTSPVFTWVVP